MLKNIFEFFKKEKGYAAALFLIVAVYGFFLLQKGHAQKQADKPSAVLEEFKKAEDQVQDKVKKLGSLEAYLKDRPDLEILANVFSLGMIGLLLGGLAVLFLFLFNPLFREKFDSHHPPPGMNWRFSLLFKFFIWFFGLNIVLGVLLPGIRRFLPVSDNFFILFHTTCVEIISFAVAAGLILKNGGSLASLGFQIPDGKWFREIRMGWTGYLATLPLFALVLIVLLIISELFHYEPPPHPLVPIFLEEGPRSPFLVIYSISLAVFFGPIFEEIFFRGFCYNVLKAKIGKAAAMVFTASFFAFIHDNSFTFWPIFVLGLGLNYVYEKRGSLLSSISMHVTHNLVFLSYFFLAKSIIGQELGG